MNDILDVASGVVSGFPVFGFLVGVALVVVFWLAASWRRVVEPNWVHIVQSRKERISYGSGSLAGNVYYQIPSWVPYWGVEVRELPISVFELDLSKYNAYDKDRVPFILDVTAFLRIEDTNLAASRIDTFESLKGQMTKSIQNTVREVLGSFDIHEIMLQRATLGAKFTESLRDELREWGVVTVKNLALNDVRDVVEGNGPIADIMAIKSASIQTDSRTAVAEYERAAREKEIEARQQIDIRDQEAKQLVGERTARQIQAVGVAEEQAKQLVAQEAKTTREREMAVLAVDTQRRAEITRDAAIVKADEEKQTSVIKAQAAKEVTVVSAQAEQEQLVLVAEGKLQEAKRDAEGIRAKGEAQGKADTAIALAPVTAQVTLAKEIGENMGYQEYLNRQREYERDEAIGIANAKALEAADIKVIANGGDVRSGIGSIGDVLSSKGGTSMAAFLEAFANSPEGSAVLTKLGIKAE